MSQPPESPAETHTHAVLDFDRGERIGISEGVLCGHKTPEQIEAILQGFHRRGAPCLLTRLDPEKAAALSAHYRERLDYDLLSRTAFAPGPLERHSAVSVAVVSGGTSDAPVCLEAARTLEFHGVSCKLFQDVGVTGLWRVMERIEEIRRYPVIIAVAGMEGALFSVLGGLVGSAVIAVPTSVGYGVTGGGRLSLESALGSCAPGLVAVNIDNGYGGGCAAIRWVNMLEGMAAGGPLEE